jgi:DNA-directed RNA polymerase subunit M/transcription elongation factor TFIIS
MTLRLVCPGCGRSLKAPDSVAGKSLQCPSCEHVFTAPAGIVDAEEVGEEAIQETRPARSSRAVQEERSEEDERQPCPMCGEMIPTQAAKCRFCGEIFDPELRRLEKRKARRARGADTDADMTTGDWVLAVLCSGIGCILGVVWLIQGKPKGGKMLGISLLFVILWNVVRFAIEAAVKN